MKINKHGVAWAECPECKWRFYTLTICSNCSTHLIEEETRQRDFLNQMNEIEFRDTVDMRFYMSAVGVSIQ